MVEVNYIAILFAGILAMAIGFVWYSEAFLGKPWMKLMGYSKESLAKSQKSMGPQYVLSFVLTLVTAFILSHVLAFSENFYGFGPVETGLSTAFWMWVGFIAPIQATDVIFGQKKWKLFWINTLYQLTALVAMGLVIGLMS